MSDVPTWALVLPTVGAFLGSALAPFVTVKIDNRLSRWRKREETMRLLRWGAEQAASDSPRAQLIGTALLRGLMGSGLLQAEDRALVRVVNQAVMGDALEKQDPGDTLIRGGSQ